MLCWKIFSYKVGFGGNLDEIKCGPFFQYYVADKNLMNIL